MRKEIITKSPQETQSIARNLAKRTNCQNSFSRTRAAVFGLVGDLGGGKTTFCQGFAKEVGVKEKILSPTFVIMKKFECMRKSEHPRFEHLYHIDCYRIKDPEELIRLDWRDIVGNPKNIILVEWADKIEEILPPDTTFIHFNFKDKNTREIVLGPRTES